MTSQKQNRQTARCEVTGKETVPMIDGLDETLSQEGAREALLEWYRNLD